MTLKAALMLGLLLPGCSMQIASGYSARAPDAVPRVLAVEAQIEDMRKDGPTLGARAVATLDSWRRPITVRNAMVNVGYQLRPREGVVGVEGGLDLGIGEPTFVDFDGAGGYVGTRVNVLFRAFGRGDRDPTAYYSVTPLIDVVMSTYAGVWTQPAATATRPVVGDVGVLVGLRFGIGTDFARSPLKEDQE